jgi:hypothetical protein
MGVALSHLNNGYRNIGTLSCIAVERSPAPKQLSVDDERVWPISSFLIVLTLYWRVTGIVLWWSYDITPLIRGGYYHRGQALSLVAKMALIITALTAAMWLLERRRDVNRSSWQLALRVACGTFFFLLGYAATILTRLRFGHYSVPLDDSAVLPVLGHVNSHFFSEVGWLTFLLDVPVFASASGIPYVLQRRMPLGSQCRTQNARFRRTKRAFDSVHR